MYDTYCEKILLNSSQETEFLNDYLQWDRM
jgi:hypothetical protein